MTAATHNERLATAVLPMLQAALGGVRMRVRGDVVGFTLRDVLFAVVQDGVLLFRVDARTRAAYDTAEAEARDDETNDASGPGPGPALDPPGGGALAVATYRRLPPWVLDDETALAKWGRAAWEAARRDRQAAGDSRHGV